MFLIINLFGVIVSVTFSRGSAMSLSVDLGQDDQFRCLLPATAPPRKC